MLVQLGMKVIGDPQRLEASLLSQLGLVNQFFWRVLLARKETAERCHANASLRLQAHRCDDCRQIGEHGYPAIVSSSGSRTTCMVMSRLGSPQCSKGDSMATSKQKQAAKRNIGKARQTQSARAHGDKVPRPTQGMSTADKDRPADSAFAFPKERKEPLTDARHVRNAIARFDQVEGVSDAERDKA